MIFKICHIINEMYKLRDWIQIQENKIDWRTLSSNKYAIPLLEKNLDKIDWYYLSKNHNAIHILEKNQEKIDWVNLTLNPNAISLLEKNMDVVQLCSMAKRKILNK